MQGRMRKVIIAAAVGVMATVAQSASAQRAGLYVEGTIGFGKADLGNTSGWTVDDKDTNWGFVAGWMANDYVGVEAGYRDLGSFSGSIGGTLSGTVYGSPFTGTGTLSASGDATGWTIGPRVSLPINDKFSVNARAGWYRWESDLKASLTGAFTWGGVTYPANAQASRTVKGTDPYWGLGARYDVSKQFGVGVGYTKFKLDDLGAKVDSWDVNVSYRF